MNILQRIIEKKKRKDEPRGVTVAFLGDSVTQGCFEIYQNAEGRVVPVTEAASAYPQGLITQLSALYPDLPFHMLNVGLSGDRAPNGSRRLASDVLSCHPDLTVVCYGLNDCSDAADSVTRYVTGLEEILRALAESGSEIVFMTPNTMNFYVSAGITNEALRDIAARKMQLQVGGCMDRHIEAAVALCRKMNVRVCDCYAVWVQMQKSGVDTTALLSNEINHPTREMHKLFVAKLLDALFAGGE